MLRENRNILELIILITYITKAFRKEIMHRSRLCNKFLRQRTNESKIAYNKQRNICVNLLRNTTRDYVANLDTRIMKDNRKVWKTVNPLFLEKSYSKESISLIISIKMV